METFTPLWKSQLALTLRPKRRIKTRTRNLFGITAVSNYIHTAAFWLVILKTWHISSSGNIMSPPWVVDWFLASLIPLFCSLVTCPLKNTRKRRFRKTAKKKVLTFFIFPTAIPSRVPSISLASRLMIHLFPRLSSNKTFTFHKTGTMVKVKTKIYI